MKLNKHPMRTPKTNKHLCKKARKRCRKGSKSVLAACVKPFAVVEVPLHKKLQDDLGFARDYLMKLPRLLKEVQEAADAVLATGRAK